MKNCQNCSKEIDENTIFCEYCGAKQEGVELICPICKEPFKIGQKRCKKCRTSLPKTYRILPNEYNKFNWGAFLNPFTWSLVHKDYKFVILFFIPFINIFIVVIPLLIWMLYYGFKGNEIGWQKFESNDIKLYDSIQRDWAKGHALVAVLIFLIWLVCTISTFRVLTPQLKENDKVAKNVVFNFYNPQKFEQLCGTLDGCYDKVTKIYDEVGEFSNLELRKSEFKSSSDDVTGETTRKICYKATCSKLSVKCEPCIEIKTRDGVAYFKNIDVFYKKK